MAQDATGTPTTKGIPKFNTAVDAPSGKGTNAMMDAIDSLLGWAKVRKNSSGSPLSRGRLNLIEGSGISLTLADDAGDNEIDVTISATGAGVTDHGLVTSLPGSPANGDYCTLTDNLTAPTYHWRLMFVSAKSSNKWIFVGGSPAITVVAASESTASTSYAPLSTAGPSFAIPVVGDYRVAISADGPNGVLQVASMSYDIGGTAASDDDRTVIYHAGGGDVTGGYREMVKTGLSVVTLTAKYKTSAGTTHFKNRVMSVTPVAIGG